MSVRQAAAGKHILDQSKRVLITGANGLLANALQKEMPENWISLLTTKETMNILSREACDRTIKQFCPEFVLHCAAYSAVDLAEINRGACYALNVEGTRHVAEACRAAGAAMVYFSTDYVFSGKGTEPWEVNSPTEPCNFYGSTKQLGERVVLDTLPNTAYIVRSSWLFGDGGRNFVDTMLQNRFMPEVRVVEDQIGSPTYTPHLATALYRLLDKGPSGFYHITSEDFCSWADLAEETFRLCGSETRVVRITSEEYRTSAKRPLNSRLSKARLDEVLVPRLPSWKAGLTAYLAQM